eukprot:GHVT01061983.1.p2 GENE.GHVT01061983.1~~GHVT01061983.1.p2  ORF type:complete len:122 (+),score=20.39 GHVT01061983.1:176-541(+)
MNSPVGVGTNRRLWLSSIALAFFFLTVGISDVRGGGEEEEDTWNYFYNDDDAITDHPKYLETRGKYFDLISKGNGEDETRGLFSHQLFGPFFLRRYSLLCLFPLLFDSLQSLFFFETCDIF